VAVSIDSLRPSYHDRFRHGRGALEETQGAVARLVAARMDVVVQTTVTRGNRDELGSLMAWAADQGAMAFNCYFVVATGRGATMGELPPAESELVLADLARWQGSYRGRMLVRAKCAPHFMRHVHATDPQSPVLNYETRCPCGTQYCRITPDGKLTPCPYLPEVAGDLQTGTFGDIWRSAPLFRRLREGALGGKCGACEYRRVCGGCRARAFARTGDVLEADSSCTYEPPGGLPVLAPPGAVPYGAAFEPALAWSPEARDRVARIPSFVRGAVMERVERFARETGRTAVTAELLAEVRRAMPIDFSKRRPFFLDEGAA
jgi:radical SAM protein with 4Fe4S-binding SPASM domain